MGNASASGGAVDAAAAQTMLANLSTMGDPFPVVFPSAATEAASGEKTEGGGAKTMQPPLYGLRVLSALAASPGASLVPWFDFIIGVDSTFFTPELEIFDDVLATCPPRLSLWVYNCKHKSQRQVTLFPRKDWGGAGLLGLAIEGYRYIGVSSELASVHITSSHSPMFQADFDYILAVDDIPCAAVEDVVLVNGSRIHIYNTARDDVRIVTLALPDPEAEVGIEVACGLIHEIPSRCYATIGRNNALPDTSLTPLNVKVKTPEGVGLLLSRFDDGSAAVQLDWDLPNGCEVVARMRSENLTVVN